VNDEMDQELKQRLIGAAVVTALAAIFIPMLFDDPVDTSGQAVSEMTIPERPAGSPNGPESKLPVDAASVENAPGNAFSSALSSGNNPPVVHPDAGGGVEKIEPGLQENAPADYEPPAEIDAAADAENAPDEEIETVPPAPAPEPALDRTPPAAASTVEKAAPKAVAAPDRTEETVTEPSAAAKPEPLQPTAAPAKAAPKSTAKFERWTIQAGSFTKKENALSQREKLRKLGFPAALETLSTSKGPIYRLKIGPELSKQRALEIRNRLNQQNVKTIILAE
jgi:DedD protein